MRWEKNVKLIFALNLPWRLGWIIKLSRQFIDLPGAGRLPTRACRLCSFPASDFTRSVARRSAKCGAIIQLKAFSFPAIDSLCLRGTGIAVLMAATSDARMPEGQLQFESESSSSAMNFFYDTRRAFFKLGREANWSPRAIWFCSSRNLFSRSPH